MFAVQRQLALRAACSYRTVSECAVEAVAGVIPIDLLAFERKNIFQRSLETGRAEAVSHERAATLRAWQQRWEAAQPGRWTARLTGDLATWISRTHGEVNFYLTQFLIGHGYFRAYLSRMGKVGSSGCRYCDAARDDALHTSFVCDRFARDRVDLGALVGDVTPDNIVRVMLGGPTE
ncbi:uncharacterized protein LOC128886297 [Hylaeus anthracinus]|uniref:uncharacterized protein LOC128886297 n=1 Tax=Hylaeus anthracinus TaxID=313031 RepID=UPI0023B9769A|nr:uncharacterized protein LOC128886297 [Hylaeus anthracinus]